MNAVIFACSHRKGGNSDRAAELLAEGVSAVGGMPEIIHVRSHEIMPCLACGYCDNATARQGIERCVLGPKDDAFTLFSHFFTARTILVASPIYFYHLPSMLKTWIDRGQQFWAAKKNGEPWMALPARTAHSVLIAGQPTGEKLFEGARLTLKYFVRNFNMDLAEPLLLRGVDKRTDLTRRADFEQQILKLGQQAWKDVA